MIVLATCTLIFAYMIDDDAFFCIFEKDDTCKRNIMHLIEKRKNCLKIYCAMSCLVSVSGFCVRI